MKRLVRPTLQDMLEAIDGIEHAALGKTISDYKSDWTLRHAIQRGIEIISEAARKIPSELRAQRTDVPWPKIFGVGNVLRHEYNRISDNVIWNVVRTDLPPLRAAIAALNDDLQEDEER